MREEQRWLLAISLSLAILFGYQALFMPQPVPPQDVDYSENSEDSETRTAPSRTQVKTNTATSIRDKERTNIPSASLAATAAQTALLPVQHQVEQLTHKKHSIALRGQTIENWNLPDYAKKLEDDGSVVDLCTGQPEPCIKFGFEELGQPATAGVVADNDTLFRAEWPVPGGKLIAEAIAQPNSRLSISFSSEGALQNVRFEPYISIDAKLEPDPSQYVFTGLRLRRAGEMESIRGGDLEDEHIWEGKFDWAMWDRKYFGRAILPPAQEVRINVLSQKDPEDSDLGTASLKMSAAPRILNGKNLETVEFQLFAGPKELDLLRKVGREIQASIDFGWTAFLARPLLSLVHMFNRLFNNYGWAIIALTILIKVVLYPLTRKSYVSMQAMSKLKPKIEELQKKHKADPQRLNQEMMALYKTEKVNPLGGCLPMLLQIPIFFSLYNVLLVSIELRHAPFMLWIDDLSSPESLITIPIMGFDLPIRLLPIVMGASMFVQQKLTPTTADPAQQKIFMLMPIMFTGLFYGFPSGLVLYWLTNNLVTIGQQWWIQKKASS